MKQLSCLLIVLIFSVISINGSPATPKDDPPSVKVISYDFLNPSSNKILSHIKSGEYVQLVITNVNPFIFDCSIGGKSVENTFPVPKIISTQLLKIPEIEGEPGAESKDIVKKKLSDYLTYLRQVQDFNARALTLTSFVLSSCSLDFQTLKSQFLDHLPAECKSNGHYTFNLYSLGQKYVTSTTEAFSSLSPEDQTKYQTLNSEFLKNSPDYLANIATADKLCTQLENLSERDLTILSTPIRADGDYIRFKVKIKQRPGVNSLCSGREIDNPKFLDIPVIGGIKVDFSSGVFFHSITDEAYQRTTLSGDTTPHYGIRRAGEEDHVSTAVGALIHVNRRGGWPHSCPFSLAASFGVGLRGEDINFYTGPSFMFGNKNRWILTTGLVVGKVKRLGSTLSTDDTYTELEATIPVESKFRFGVFVGFTFNFNSMATEPSEN